MGRVIAVCISEKKGTQKQNAGKGICKVDHGLVGDAHAGKWHRQVSLLSFDRIEEFRAKGAIVAHGAFGENLVVEGIDFSSLPIGTRLQCNDVVMEVSQIGKECHAHCAIYHAVGDCIMPREGIFTKILREGEIAIGDDLFIMEK